MRTLSAELTTALDSGSFTPYFEIQIVDTLTGEVVESTPPLKYKLGNLTLSFKIQAESFISLDFAKHMILLTRGATVSDVNYTVSTSYFRILNTLYDGSFMYFECHLIPATYYTAAGDDTYENVISAYCQSFGKTAVFLDPTAAWLDYQFYPTGKTLTLNNAQQFFTILRQKYFIFATDNGSDEILFYTAFSHVGADEYQVQAYHYKVDFNTGLSRRYLWRDENNTTHLTEPTFELQQQIHASDYVVTFFENDDKTILAGTGAVGVYKSTDEGKTWTGKYYYPQQISAFAQTQDGVIMHAGHVGSPSSTGTYLSTDKGETWNQISALNITSIPLIHIGNNVCLMGETGSTANIYRSTDGGRTWTLITQLGTETWVFSLELVANNTILAGTQPNGKIYKSTDGGLTWTLKQSLGANDVPHAILNIGNGIVIAGTGATYLTAHIWRSTDYGNTWTLIQALGTEQVVFCLTSVGNGVIAAGTYNNGQTWISVDNGLTWSLVTQLGTETDVRAILTISNKSILAGTGSGGNVYASRNFLASTFPIHNLGFLPSTAAEPDAYYQPRAPEIEPLPPHLKYQSSDYIELLLQSGSLFINCAEITEELDIDRAAMAWNIKLTDTAWLSNTDGGPLPSTIERVAPYTPLATLNFNNFLNGNVNNLQALADYVDDHVPVQEQNTNDIFRVDNPGGASAFAGTISAHSGASVTYTPVSGSEAVMVPTTTTQLGKMRLYNTTRGNYALISNCNTTTNVITLTANAPSNWANGDTITVTSQTTSGGGWPWIDIQITSGPIGKASLFLNVIAVGSVASQAVRLHPFSATFSSSQYIAAFAQVNGVSNVAFGIQKTLSSVFSISWEAGIGIAIVREQGFFG